MRRSFGRPVGLPLPPLPACDAGVTVASSMVRVAVRCSARGEAGRRGALGGRTVVVVSSP